MKAVVAAFNQEKALVGAFSVITNLRMELFEALMSTVQLMIMIALSNTLTVTVTFSPHTSPHLGSFTLVLMGPWE